MKKLLLLLPLLAIASCAQIKGNVGNYWDTAKDMAGRAEFKQELNYKPGGWVCWEVCGRLRPGERIDPATGTVIYEDSGMTITELPPIAPTK